MHRTQFLPEMTMQKITPVQYLIDAKNNQYSKCQNTNADYMKGWTA